MPNHHTSISEVQTSLLQTARELRAIDHRLAELAESIQPRLDQRLPDELHGGTQCVRHDLLSDAIETLETLGHASEESLSQRSFCIEDAAQQIAAFG